MTPTLEATGPIQAAELATVGQSLLDAAQHAYRLFGTPTPTIAPPTFDPYNI